MGIMRVFAAVTLCALAVGCAPPQSNSSSRPKADEPTGALKVWLFDEPTRAPKEAAVNEAKKEFEAAHPGVAVTVEYVPIETRASKFNGAFNDKASAPDVAEFGNTDLSSYVASGGFADVTSDVQAWKEGANLLPSVLDTAKVDGKVYAVPWYTGTRALYYRTDVFSELGLTPPKTLAELTQTARKVRAARPDLYGIAAGGKYTYALFPYIWANGGDVATQQGGKWTSAVTSPQARDGFRQYAELIHDDICPPAQCAQLTGSQSLQAFAGGKAAMAVGGDFNRKAVEAGAVKGKYSVVPLPGTTPGSIAPAFAGGNVLGVFQSSQRRTLALQFVELLGGKKYAQKMYDAMGNMPTFGDVQNDLAKTDPFLVPFIATIQKGTKFIPTTPSWSKIDAQLVLPTAVQKIATEGKSVEAATDEAAAAMNAAFGG